MTEQTKAITKVEPDFFQLLVPDQIRKFICPTASDRAIGLFLIQAKMWSLNPFKREIYLIQYSPSDPPSIVISFDSFLKRAERTNKLRGWRAWTEGEIKGKDFKAVIEIWRADWDKPFVHEVFWDEYKGTKRDGTLTRFWAEKPRTMLKKVVISQGFRMCFPDELGGMPYSAEEVNSVDVEALPKAEVEVLPKDEPQPQAPAPKTEPKPPAAKPSSKPKSEPPKSAPKPSPMPEQAKIDQPPATEEEDEPLPTPIEEEESGEPGDQEQKTAIINAFLKLAELGRDRKELEPKLRKAMVDKFGSQVATIRIPEDLSPDVGAWVLSILGKTIEKQIKNGG